jgi:Tfp pilus assembly protein PilE
MAQQTQESFGWARNVLAVITILALLITSAGWAYIKGYQVDQNTARLEKHQAWMENYEIIDRATGLSLQKLEIEQRVIKETVLEIKEIVKKRDQNHDQ